MSGSFQADRTGIEPATSDVTGRHSNQAELPVRWLLGSPKSGANLTVEWIDATKGEKKLPPTQYIRALFTRNSSRIGSKPRLMSASTRSMRYWPHLSFSWCQWAAMAVR